MWQRRLSAESSFCKAVVSCGYLTQEQMERAVQRYRLGCSRDGGVIFWQIDQLDHVFDGKIMYYRPDCHRDHQRHPNWVSHLLKWHYGCQGLDIPSVHCLFGMHLVNVNLNDNLNLRSATIGKATGRRTQFGNDASLAKNDYGNVGDDVSVSVNVSVRRVAVVESEKTAVIMSELFPDTDEHHESYKLWYDVAQEARRVYGIRCTVSPLLELKATPEQKARKIDLVDYLFSV